MEMLIHCRGCGVALRVDETWGGKTVRCPNCKCMTTIPLSEELLEETACCWIEELVLAEEKKRDSERAEHEMELEKTVFPGKHTADATEPVAPDKPAPKASAPRDENSPDMDDALELTPEEVANFIESAEEAETSKAAFSDAAPKPIEEQIEQPTPSATNPALSNQRTARPAQSLPDYPTNMPVDADRPYLLVCQVHTNGVILRFEARWLECERFRASLPMCCVISGEANRTKLLARPLVFGDQSRGKITSVEPVEARHEQTVNEVLVPADIVQAMGMLMDLPHPVNLAMPYYVSVGHRHESIRCSASMGPDGRLMCDVAMPNLRVALDWLGRVNGVCGPEYERLEQDVLLTESCGWREMEEVTRQRIAVWCDFEPRERFITYVADSDFSKRDAGLAGLVITDRRLVFHKHHRNGEVRFNEPATLYLRKGDNEVAVVLETGHSRSRVGKIKPDDMHRVIDALANAERLRVVVTRESKDAKAAG